MKVKEESEKVGLKLNIQQTKIMASVPITSWEIDGETVEAVADFTFLGSKITANGDLEPQKRKSDPKIKNMWVRKQKQECRFDSTENLNFI